VAGKYSETDRQKGPLYGLTVETKKSGRRRGEIHEEAHSRANADRGEEDRVPEEWGEATALGKDIPKMGEATPRQKGRKELRMEIV